MQDRVVPWIVQWACSNRRSAYVTVVPSIEVQLRRTLTQSTLPRDYAILQVYYLSGGFPTCAPPFYMSNVVQKISDKLNS